MAAGYHDFTAGETLTAANLEDYCQNQSVMRFASAAARDTALSAVLTEGLMAYLIDTNSMCVYSGSAWSTIGPVHGSLTGWTPTITQSGSVTVTVNRAWYQRIGRKVECEIQLTVTGTGTGANAVIIGALPFTGNNANIVVGSGYIQDNSASLFYQGTAIMESTTSVSLLATDAAYSNPRLGVNAFTAALALNDVISAHWVYEAAADA